MTQETWLNRAWSLIDDRAKCCELDKFVKTCEAYGFKLTYASVDRETMWLDIVDKSGNRVDGGKSIYNVLASTGICTYFDSEDYAAAMKMVKEYAEKHGMQYESLDADAALLDSFLHM